MDEDGRPGTNLSVGVYDDRTAHDLVYTQESPPPPHTPSILGHSLPYSRPSTLSPTPSSSWSDQRHTMPPPEPRQMPFDAESTEEIAGPSCFTNSHHFTIGTLNTNLTTNVPNFRTLFEHLNPYITHAAAHNSDERCDAPSCDPRTRVGVRMEIMKWMRLGTADPLPTKLMWLSGPAGSGKTAIALSVADLCHSEKLLAASFFFSSCSVTASRRSKRGFIATLAYHIAEHGTLWQFRTQLLLALERHPDIFRKNLKEQAECLLLGPLRISCRESNRSGWPKVIIVDGLDEVEAEQYHDPKRKEGLRAHENDQLEILNVLFSLSQCSIFPFRIFVSSRPESGIAGFFTTSARARTTELFLDSKYNPDADIRRFLEEKFNKIRQEAGITSLSWPGEATLDRLVDMSSGQFIVPDTIVRWVERGIPQQQLDDVLQLELRGHEAENPFATLDKLFRLILERSPNPSRDPHLVVKWIRCIEGSHNDTSVAPPAKFWKLLLEDIEGEVIFRMKPLASLISIPPPDTSAPITIYHKSLIDFLSTKARCKDLYVDEMSHDSFIASRIVRILKNKASANVLSLPIAADPLEFLRIFQDLKMVRHSTWTPGASICEHLLQFLASLNNDSKDDLALCDAAWWTGLYLTHTGSHAEGFEINQFDECANLLGSMYCRIHKAMECDSNPYPSAHDTLLQVPRSRCHAACIRWREGILAKAKELKWCVHEMEQVKLDSLHNMTVREVNQKFRRMRPGSFCAVCQPSEGRT
ncbi:hypothetical protein FA13DRAFT_1739074 [Coprinellus micaceus]|uniref:Nephrocystin 3-like N-terminal domain-containing protein n=1 Tax=Coprinellus micaceus TaxID=71717 RepID=A0A4Y7SRV6_COPMI|nr:hypothetical protein FA13DRAFT_1739074 [Coprinellus micaceus]